MMSFLNNIIGECRIELSDYKLDYKVFDCEAHNDILCKHCSKEADGRQQIVKTDS